MVKKVVCYFCESENLRELPTDEALYQCRDCGEYFEDDSVEDLHLEELRRKRSKQQERHLFDD